MIHGIMMMSVFAFLLPLGSLFARYHDWWGKGWIWVHLATQLLSFVVFTGSFVYILVRNDLPPNWISLKVRLPFLAPLATESETGACAPTQPTGRCLSQTSRKSLS